jgi:hypothetical protein
MAAGAVALVIGTAVIGWVVKRDKAAELSPALREAIWLGFLLTFVLTMITAGYMSVGRPPRRPPPRGRADRAALRLVRRHRRPAARPFRALHAMQAHSQKMTVAARAMADRKTFGHRS